MSMEEAEDQDANQLEAAHQRSIQLVQMLESSCKNEVFYRYSWDPFFFSIADIAEHSTGNHPPRLRRLGRG